MASKKERLKDTLRPLLEHLIQGLGQSLIALVLFGSRARSNKRDASDWDIFVLARSLPTSPIERYASLRELCPVEPTDGFSFLAKTQEEFEDGFPSFYLDLALDGIILFDTSEYMENKLNHIQKLIKEAGLKREKIPGGFFWDWDKYPGPDWQMDWSGFHTGE
jgi:uncharacterized protein